MDVPDRGEAWTAYLADVRDRLDDIAAGLSDPDLEPGPSVALVGWDEDAETKVAAMTSTREARSRINTCSRRSPP